MFEKAARLKLRYDTPKGSLSVEDLWDLPLTSQRGMSIDDIAIRLHNLLKTETVSFVDDAATADIENQLRFDIVKHVITVRKEENRKVLEARNRADQKQKILAIISRKEDAALENMDSDKLREMVAAL